MAGLVDGVRSGARDIARAAVYSAAFGIAALLLALIGLGCLTAALWIVIATHQGAVFAFAFIGVIYLALAALFLALAAHPARQNPANGQRQQLDDARNEREPFVQIAEGFAMGMEAGRAARGQKR